MIVNVYFPPDPNTKYHIDTEHEHVLATIRNIFETQNFTNILIGCDLNYDEGGDNGRAERMQKILLSNLLVMLWEFYDIVHL